MYPLPIDEKAGVWAAACCTMLTVRADDGLRTRAGAGAKALSAGGGAYPVDGPRRAATCCGPASPFRSAPLVDDDLLDSESDLVYSIERTASAFGLLGLTGSHDGEAGSKRAKNAAAESQRTSRSTDVGQPFGIGDRRQQVGQAGSGFGIEARRRLPAAARVAGRRPVRDLPQCLARPSPEPLLGPLGDPFDQRRARLLQRPYRQRAAHPGP